MELGKHDIVGGLVGVREDASAEAPDLRLVSSTERAVDASAHAHTTARSEAADLGNGVVIGVIVGIVVGALLGIGLLFAALPVAMVLEARGLLLGAIIGGFWGSFFGGLAGMAVKAAGHEA